MRPRPADPPPSPPARPQPAAASAATAAPGPARPGARWRRAGATLLALALCCGGVLPTQAAGPATAQPERTQFLLVVDESASMGRFPPHTDEDRLALLAAQGFLELLGPTDRARVLGMNELAKLSLSTPLPGYLLPVTADEGRVLAQGHLDPMGPGLGAYKGQETPCRDALAAAGALLDQWHERDPPARQVLLFLTDGRCEGRRPQDPLPAPEWLGARASFRQSPELLRVFLLRFEGNEVSPGLAPYAALSGGRALGIPAGARRAQGIVRAFADVFAGAQGYTALLLGRGQEARSFARAERLRVLALRRAGERRPLEIRLLPEAGPPPPFELSASRGFQRKGQTRYELRHATILPNGTRFRVEVPDADAVLIPDYRGLRAELTVLPEACGASAEETCDPSRDVDLVTAGGTACLQARLVASRGPLSPTDDLAFVGRYALRQPGGPWSEAHGMLARPDGFVASLPVAAETRVELRADLLLEEAAAALRSPAHPLQAEVLEWSVRARSGGALAEALDLGAIPAGETRTFDLHFAGRFPANMQVALEPTGALRGHPCLRLRQEASDSLRLRLAPEQERRLQLVTTPCRPGARLDATLRFVPPDTLPLPALELPLRGELLPTPFWQVWGRRILVSLATLLTLLLLYCFVQGWRTPARRLPPARRGLAFYFARDPALLRSPAAEFKVPNEQRGAYELAPHLDGTWGWYRNACLPLGQRGCRLPSPGVELPIELQPGPGRLRAIQGSPGLELHRFDPYSSPRSAQAFQPEPFGERPRATLAEKVGLPCRWLARACGRLPAVRSLPLELGVWYRVGGPEARYFFKLDDSPSAGG